ncbi:unnamed protein product [Closterium sp. NIES-64]|nr:unnamed protein product [Closterium sp. NIES-64]
MRPLLCVFRVGLSALFAGERGATADDVIHFLAEAAPEATSRLIRAGLATATHHSSGDGTQGPHQPPARLQTCIACPTPPPLFPLSSPQCPTIALVMGPKALVMGPKGLITPKCDDSGSPHHSAAPHHRSPTIALVMGLKGLISRLLAPKLIGVCPAFALDIGPKGLISHAESGRSQTGATVELHRQEYHRIFKAHAQVPFEKVTDLLQRPDRELFGRAALSGTTNDGGVENATASSHPSAPPLPVGGGGDGEGILSTSSVPTLPVGGGGDVEGMPSTPSVPPLPAGGGHHANSSMSLPTASPSTMNGMSEDRPVCSHPRASACGTVPMHWPTSPSVDDIPEQRIFYYVTTRKGVDDKSSVRLERVAFDRGVDELKLLGFDVKGIISDQGTAFRGAAVELKLDHQVDWWHVKRTLYNLFCKELQDQVRMAVEVDKASCVEELWLAKVEDCACDCRARGLEEPPLATPSPTMLQQGTGAAVRGGRSRGAMARGDEAMARNRAGRWAGTGPGAGQVRGRALGRNGAGRWAGTGPGAGQVWGRALGRYGAGLWAGTGPGVGQVRGRALGRYGAGARAKYGAGRGRYTGRARARYEAKRWRQTEPGAG